MVPTRKRIFLILLVIAALGLLLRIIYFSNPLETIKNDAIIRKTPGSSLPVLVTVYYEALCPDSKYFIYKQLLPVYKAAAPIMDVQLIPYGKAETTVDSEGKLSFTCQHGLIECQANIYHGCVAEFIVDPLVRLEVITCMIRDNRNPKEAMLKCTEQHNEENALIQKCYDSGHGANVLKVNGEATHALRPKITFIPTITLDGSQGRQPSILKDLLGEVCKVAGSSEQVQKICNNK